MPERLALKDHYREIRIYRMRTAVAVLSVMLLLGIILSRYHELQIEQHEVYRTQSDRNRVQLLPVPPKRGLIFDRQGTLLAENLPSYSLALVKERVEDLDQTLTLLQQLVPIDERDIEKFRKRLYRRRPYEAVPLRFRLTEEEIAIIAVNRSRLPGVQVKAELVRHYPEGLLTAHVLGYVGRINESEQQRIDESNYAGTHHIGKIGLEKFYEGFLHGQVGTQNVETNARGRILRVLEQGRPEPGSDLHLFLDMELQQVAYEALGDKRGSVVAIDPRTGGVLAMVSTPSFDPNLFVNGISQKNYSALRESLDLPLFNRSLQGQYPPGSTVKPIYGLAGLHYGTVTAQTRIKDPGFYQLPNDERLYRDWKKGGHAASVDLRQSLVESCDVYYYDLAYRLGIDRLAEYTAPFGFGEVTGIDNTHERRGIMPSKAWKKSTGRGSWFHGETLNVGIGQGYMLATPLQLAVAAATLANRGLKPEPRLVRAVGDMDLPLPEMQPVPETSEAHWQTVIDAMVDTVHSVRGTARKSGLRAKYKFAGKTGTAQVIGIAQDEEYDAEEIAIRKRDHGLFIAFAPAQSPRIAIAVVVENGEHGSWGAPIARKVFDAYLLDENGELRLPEESLLAKVVE